jgi:pyruvate-ferredoxin/flavodoxin oxidoreductase
MAGRMVTIDGNEAAAYVAHRTNEVIAIYPITRPRPWASWRTSGPARARRTSGARSPVVEMQSEGGAAGAVHGALQAGA